MKYCYFSSPIGELLLAGDGEVLELLGFPGGSQKKVPEEGWEKVENLFPEVTHQLSEYFAGNLKQFNLQLSPSGTEFQLQVLDALQKIPYGETISYGELAERIGRPKASRAVGAANARNPLPVIIPCHRVIGTNGNLTGFGGGIERKVALLELEARNR
ncbi:MAG: methylated-DNA--[protein]-cysteine S-methyltransferase [Proteobacteria bacterium]|nr:methylated-DNA--[protein]-cysteine S-methyltransferase [Pseudomonadota bacterium]